MDPNDTTNKPTGASAIGGVKQPQQDAPVAGSTTATTGDMTGVPTSTAKPASATAPSTMNDEDAKLEDTLSSTSKVEPAVKPTSNFGAMDSTSSGMGASSTSPLSSAPAVDEEKAPKSVGAMDSATSSMTSTKSEPVASTKPAGMAGSTSMGMGGVSQAKVPSPGMSTSTDSADDVQPAGLGTSDAGTSSDDDSTGGGTGTAL